MGVDLITVTQAVLITISRFGIRVVSVEFSGIVQAVGVGVLFAIHSSIAIRVWDQWI